MRSKFERRVALQLQDNGIDYEYEQWTYEYSKPVGRGECGDCGSRNVRQTGLYLTDFTFGPACPIVIETKGRLTAKDRRKMVLLKQQHPDTDFRLLFMQDNKLPLKQTPRYSSWAEHHGFTYAFKAVPPEWIKEIRNATRRST